MNEEMDPIQFSLTLFGTCYSECMNGRIRSPREIELADFLVNVMMDIRSVSDNMKALDNIMIGANAIYASLDGSKSWHQDCLTYVGYIFDGINGFYHEAGIPPVKKSSFGEQISRTLVREDVSSDPCFIASDPDTPVDLLLELSNSDNWEVRAKVAGNASTPIDVIRRLSEETDEGVRAHAGRNPNAPIDVLERLASDWSEYVRQYVADNPNAPSNILAILANDSDWRPRSSVAENANTDVDTMVKLTSDPDWRVRALLADNPKCPPDVLTVLTTDNNSDVVKRVRNNPNFKPRYEVVSDPVIPEDYSHLSYDTRKWEGKFAASIESLKNNVVIQNMAEMLVDYLAPLLKAELSDPGCFEFRSPHNPDCVVQASCFEKRLIMEDVDNPNCIVFNELSSNDADHISLEAIAAKHGVSMVNNSVLMPGEPSDFAVCKVFEVMRAIMDLAYPKLKAALNTNVKSRYRVYHRFGDDDGNYDKSTFASIEFVNPNYRAM